MRGRRWTARWVLVGLLAVATLIAAGVLLGPTRTGEPGRPAAAAPVPATHDLDAYVARTTAHLNQVPGDWQSWAQLGMAHVQLARLSYDPAHYPAAAAALRRSLRVRPTGNAAALTGLGALAAAQHDFRGALRYARGAVAADHYSADAYGVLTDAYVELGRYPEATAAVQRMLDLRPDTGSFARASYLFELHGDTGRATRLMRQALDVATSPGDTTFALLHLGELAFNAGDLDTAAARFAEGLARTPGQPALLADRAKVAAARGDLASARTDLRAATAVLPTVDHLVTESDVLNAAGDPVAAARTDDLVRVGARLPGVTPASTDIDLVLFYADHGAAAEAVARGRALLAARPSVSVETAYAWALHAAGRDREALTHADRGLRLGTRDARAHYYRGMIRLALHDRDGARADLRQALAINPYFSLRYGPVARQALATLGGRA
ncbi:tetratricopeptide repeat protein [Krasilnikovia sp. MM14-A1004]|uniref:tetratricopeptide repeat protein n=1 Tax=Krasilnikovia sp. MM14-A1004 TaxID=3373541 RepID=UPI00399C5B8A